MGKLTIVWRAIGLLVSSILLFMILTWVLIASADAQERPSSRYRTAMVSIQGTPTPDATMTELQKEQLEQEIVQLKNQNNWNWTAIGATIGGVGTFILAFVGIITVRNSFQQWLGNRQDEQKKRDEERFQTAVAALGNKDEDARIGAAIMLRTFVHKGYEQFCSQAYDLVCVYLHNRQKDQNTPAPLDPFSQALITVFRESFPLARDNLKKSLNKEGTILTFEEILPLVHNAAGIQLDNAYLSHADLAEVQLREAYLREAILYKANLTNAGLKRARLKNANLSKAKLNGADLTGADLTEANLEEANPEEARWLIGTKMRGVTGLTPQQRDECRAKGANLQ